LTKVASAEGLKRRILSFDKRLGRVHINYFTDRLNRRRSAISSKRQKKRTLIQVRFAARVIEALVIKAVRDHLKPSEPTDDRNLVHTHVTRVEVQADRLVIHLAEPPSTLEVLWQKTPARRRREILLPEGLRPEQTRPMRSETRARLVATIARGRRWLDELIADATASAESIGKREQCSARKINMTISLAFLAPDLVEAAIDGRLPHGMGVARLTDLPAEWSRQHQMLGLPAQ
jgi:site-specific DNA recombinase